MLTARKICVIIRHVDPSLSLLLITRYVNELWHI